MIDKWPWALVHSSNLRPRHGARLSSIIPREMDVIGLGNTHGWWSDLDGSGRGNWQLARLHLPGSRKEIRAQTCFRWKWIQIKIWRILHIQARIFPISSNAPLDMVFKQRRKVRPLPADYRNTWIHTSPGFTIYQMKTNLLASLSPTFWGKSKTNRSAIRRGADSSWNIWPQNYRRQMWNAMWGAQQLRGPTSYIEEPQENKRARHIHCAFKEPNTGL